MGGTCGTCKAASAVTAWEAAAAAAERSLAACCLRIRSSRSEIGGFTKDFPLRVGILLGKGLKETSDKDLPTRITLEIYFEILENLQRDLEIYL